MDTVSSLSHHLEFARGTSHNYNLHVKEWSPLDVSLRKKPVILYVHGAIENGKIFYSLSGKGIAPYLARLGWRGFVLDRRGRGQSTPKISSSSEFTQWDEISQDLVGFSDWVAAQTHGAPQIWVNHSWGGTLVLALLARFPKVHARVGGLVFFGAKRRIREFSFEILLKINFVWNHFAGWLAQYYGFLPADVWGMGSDRETIATLKDSVNWVRSEGWVDAHDGFDYRARLPEVIPELPQLWMTGAHDHALAHPNDVKRLMQEIGLDPGTLKVIGLATGYRQDYGHIDLMTAPEAEQDHFADVKNFILALPS